MGGRTPQRTAEAAEELAPPLEAVWTADVTGGFGQGGVAVVDSTVFAVNLRGELYGIDLVTGKRLGWVDLGEAYEGAPAVNGGRVFLASSAMTESFHSYDLATGKREWRASVGESETSPLLYRGRLYGATLSGSLVCLDPTAGAELWRVELPDNRRLKGIRSNPAADSGLVVFGADDGGVYCLDAVSGKLRWRVETATAVTAPVAVSGGRERWRNSLGVRIPQSFAVQARVAEGTAVDIAIEDDRLVVKPVLRQYRLRDLLKRMDRRNRHSEIPTGPAVGKEAW